MSFPSNEPFQPASQIPNPYGDSSSYKPAAGFGGPYAPPSGPQPPKQSQGCLIAGILGGILGVVGLICAGCCGMGFFALDAEYKETARQLSVDYRNDPIVKEHVGEVQEITYNWSATLSREDDDLDVYDIVGDKGKAQLVVDADEDAIYSVTLQNGKGEWDLTHPDDMAHEDMDHAHDDAEHLHE